MYLNLRTAAAFAALAITASPASAGLWLVQGIGTIVQTPTPQGETRLEGVPFDGLQFDFALTVDDTVPGADLSPPLGIGSFRTYRGAVTSLTIGLGGWQITRTSAAIGALNVADDVPNGPNTTGIDQLTYSESLQFPGGILTPALQTDAPLAPNQFFGTFSFGRVVSLPVPQSPDMIVGSAIPALDSVWQAGAQGMLFTFDVREGDAFSPGQANALPRARFAGTRLNFQVIRLDNTPAVPEPASWALMIAGFGLTGAALRRRTPATA